MPTDLKKYITNYSDFPTPGVLFRDISPLLSTVTARNEIVEKFKEFISLHQMTTIVGIDARGFIIGSLLAERYQLPFVMIRKKGKLPDEMVFEASYVSEYSHETLIIQKDILQSTDHVLIIDDILATGGTLQASIRLVQQCGVTSIALGVLVELAALGGRQKIEPFPLLSTIIYE